MTTVNVFLVRPGESVVEGAPVPDLPNLHTVEAPSVQLLEQIGSHLDPQLTMKGFQQAEASFRAMGRAFDGAGDIRKIAMYSAPYKRCLSSAMLISIAGFEPEDWSNWGLTTPETASAPTGIPVVVLNGLADCTPQIRQLGGLGATVNAGLISCSAKSWNKAYKKDPIMGEIHKWKMVNRTRVQQWQSHPLEEGQEQSEKFVADLQYLKFSELRDPYSLTPMSIKFNIPTELIVPNKFLPPPRQGVFHTKDIPVPRPTGLATVNYAVATAVKTGCDTVICVVPSELIQQLCEHCDGSNIGVPEPAAIGTFTAQATGNDVSYKFHGLSNSRNFSTHSLPPFTGPLEPTVAPPADFAKAMAEAGEEKWGTFKPPEPENIPNDYPSDIPPFGNCLELPTPMASWSYQHQQLRANPDKPESPLAQ